MLMNYANYSHTEYQYLFRTLTLYITYSNLVYFSIGLTAALYIPHWRNQEEQKAKSSDIHFKIT